MDEQFVNGVTCGVGISLVMLLIAHYLFPIGWRLLAKLADR